MGKPSDDALYWYSSSKMALVITCQYDNSRRGVSLSSMTYIHQVEYSMFNNIVFAHCHTSFYSGNPCLNKALTEIITLRVPLPYAYRYQCACTFHSTWWRHAINSHSSDYEVRHTLQWRHNEHDGVSNTSLTQAFIQAQIKENIKAPRHWLLWGEFTGDRWIPRTKRQQRGKCFHLMTSSFSPQSFSGYQWFCKRFRPNEVN